MRNIFSTKVLAASFIIAVIYIVVTIYLMNFSLVRNTIVGNYPLEYKGRLLLALAQGMWTAMTKQALSLLFVTALLTGVNLSLLVNRLKELKRRGNIRFVVGGSSLLGIVGSGCAACGLPILALVGLSGSLAYLPFRGSELSYLAVMLLLLSFIILIRTNNDQSCKIALRA